jgi:hypothetical protein
MDEGQKRAADVLVQWREVERAMEDPAVGEEGLKMLQAEAERLRDEYQRLVRPDPSPDASRTSLSADITA